MAIQIGALAKTYVDSCRKHGVFPNTGLLTAILEKTSCYGGQSEPVKFIWFQSSLRGTSLLNSVVEKWQRVPWKPFSLHYPRGLRWELFKCSYNSLKVEVRKSHDELCSLEILLDPFKDIDFRPLLEVCTLLGDSVIEAVDVRVEASCALSGEYALSLMQAVDQKLRTVELHDLLFGKQFLREFTQRGLNCQILILRSSLFRKLNIVGVFARLHTLNLDYSTSLTSFKEDCFSGMPNLICLSMCETRIANLWTTIAALSRLPSLSEVRFQNWLCYNDAGSSGSSDGSQTDLSEPNYSPYSGKLAIDTEALRALNTRTEEVIRLLLPYCESHDLQTTRNVSSDDGEVDFSINSREYGYVESSSAAPGWNSDSNMQSEDPSDSRLSRSDEESSAGAFTMPIADVSMKYISEHASPICFEKHYRDYMIASLPKLKLLDNLPVNDTDRERATITFSKHFEYLPYKRKKKESVVSILQNREIRASHSLQNPNQRKPNCSGKSQLFYSRSLCAAKMGSSAWPLLHSLSISGNDLGNGSMSFRPRQFEYHPCDSSLMVFGTLDGEVVAVNHENEKIVGYIPSVGAMNSVLGLCWLKKYPSKLIAGSDNGSLKLYDVQNIHPTARHPHTVTGSVTFDDFDQLTSVHVNSTDELFLASGYSRNVALYDINSGRQIKMFTDMHRAHINVVKFSNHSPSVFATSSFDGDIKMWDLRQQPIRPCYASSSSKGNVMVCFSPDDHYLLASAIDNEVRQFLAVDGRLNLNFEIAPTGSSQNYTRSYYMNGRDYIISGSCDEHVVRVCCAQTGRRLRDISLEGKSSGTSMFVQSLRGDPFRDFNMSILAAYTRPSSKSEIVKVNLLASSECGHEGSTSRSSCPSSSMGG